MTDTCISPREKQVLGLIADENSTKMIAKELFISEHTVSSHRKNLMTKLNASNTAGLVRRAFETGVLHLSRQVALLGLLFISVGLTAQQQEIQYNSDSKLSTNGPHLLITETDDPGQGANDDGFTRMWFKNSSFPNYWSFAARPHEGTTDRDGILFNPIVIAYGDVDSETRTQKFGFSSDGTMRINKQYTLPNMAGDLGQVLIVTDTSNNLNTVTDWGYMDYIEKDAAFDDVTLQLHENSNGAAILGFSNDQFANNRFFISADPTPTGALNAEMNFRWGDATNAASLVEFITLNATDERVEVARNLNLAHQNVLLNVFTTGNQGFRISNENDGSPQEWLMYVQGDNVNGAPADIGDLKFYSDHDSNPSPAGVSHIRASIDHESGVYSNLSDRRLKTEIEYLNQTVSLEKLLQLKPASYKIRNQIDTGISYGMIAQEVQEVLPNIVTTMEETEDEVYFGLTYDEFIPVVISAVQEQQAIIDTQNKTIATLQNQMAKVNETLAELTTTRSVNAEVSED